MTEPGNAELTGRARSNANLRPFKKGDAETQAKARKGGAVTAAQTRKAKRPYDGTVLDLMDAVGLSGPSWRAHRTILRYSLALPHDGGVAAQNQDYAFYVKHTGRQKPPSHPVDELWIVAGRRGGKSRASSVVGVHTCISHDSSTLSPGEIGVLPLVASTRRQASVLFNYVKALCDHDAVRPYVHRIVESDQRVEFRTGANAEVMVGSFRSLRGNSFIGGGPLDEVAFWRDESTSSNPDTAILEAIRPAIVPGGLLFAISSPYAQRGELYNVYQRYHATEDPHTIVWNLDTATLNPTYPRHKIAREFEKDPISAASEYGQDGHVVFRSDVEAYLAPETITACTVVGRYELPPVYGTKYIAFVDPAGGSGQDSFTVAIAHVDASGRAVLDAVRETKPPFSPSAVVERYADLLHSYGCTTVTGDRYAGEWPREGLSQSRHQVHTLGTHQERHLR